MKSLIRYTLRKISPLENLFWRDWRHLRKFLKIFQRIQNISSSKYPLGGGYILRYSRSDVPKMLNKPKLRNLHPTRKQKTSISLSLKTTLNNQFQYQPSQSKHLFKMDIKWLHPNFSTTETDLYKHLFRKKSQEKSINNITLSIFQSVLQKLLEIWSIIKEFQLWIIGNMARVHVYTLVLSLIVLQFLIAYQNMPLIQGLRNLSIELKIIFCKNLLCKRGN